ncbi:MAG: ABC transporter substrate-binding protein [Solirubrobacteraceae bacterium]
MSGQPGTPTPSGGENEGELLDPGAQITRRTALRYAGGGLAALGGAGWLVSAPGGASAAARARARRVSRPRASSDPSVPVASKGNPLTLSIYSDNKPIASHMRPEKGPLVIFDWSDYLSPAVIKSFEKRYGVSAQLTVVSSIDEAINKIASGVIKPDVWVPQAQRIAGLVEAKLIQPINHSYIPNLDHVVPAAGDPWYDKGARYSTPNFINMFGIQWRNDLIKIHPSSMKNPWNVFWQIPRTTTIGMMNGDPEDALEMAMLHLGAKNFDTITEHQISDAQAALAELHNKWQYTGFQPIATGVEKISYGYNGDMMQVPHYLTKGTKLSDVSFYFPPSGRGPILNDMWVIPRTAEHPVLAHLWMNHFLEKQSAIDNFRDEGYQTMLEGLTIKDLEDAKAGPKHAIQMAFATAAMQANGLAAPVFNPHQLAWIEAAFSRLTS